MDALGVDDVEALTARSRMLGEKWAPLRPSKSACRRSVRFPQINHDQFIHQLSQYDIPDLRVSDGEAAVDHLTDVLYSYASKSRIKSQVTLIDDLIDDRWQRILDTKDNKQLWQSINWKGEYGVKSDEVPSDEMFKEHFEDLLNLAGVGPLRADDFVTDISIPVLDDPIDPGEVLHVIERQLKHNKSCGPEGICPGVFKLLTDPWLAFITALLNVIFYTGYPVAWMYTCEIDNDFQEG